MNSKMIQHALFNQFGQASQLMIPNYTPRHWFECDMVRVTKAGFLDEYEIKISVADFKADAKKGPDEREKTRMASYPLERQQKLGFEFRSKHERLEQRDTRGPCRFWFVMPEDIAAKVEIPSWAGLITVRPYGKGVRIVSLYNSLQFKQAPKLHSTKADAEIIANIRSVFYYRYWSIRQGAKEEVAS